MNDRSLIAVLVTIIILLVGSHYGSTVYEIRKVQSDVTELRREVTAAALETAKAATATAETARQLLVSRESK